MLKTFGLDPKRMTPAQIKRGGKLLAIISREPCGDTRPDRKPTAIEAWRELVNEVRQRGGRGMSDILLVLVLGTAAIALAVDIAVAIAWLKGRWR
jgi:hypothetical protein